MTHRIPCRGGLARSLALALAAGLAFTGCVVDEAPADATVEGADAGPGRDARLDPPDGGPDPDADPGPAPDAGPDATPDGPPAAACDNGADDDGDGLIDLDDPGCAGPGGLNEADPDPLPACGNGIDDDDDGLVDFPADPDCSAAGGPTEGEICGPGRAITPLPLDTPVEVILSRGMPVADAACGAPGTGPAAIARVVAPGSGFLLITATPPDGVRLFARRSCRDRRAELGCRAAGEPGPLRLTVDAGDEIYVFAQPSDGILPRPVRLEARLEPRDDDCRNGVDDDGDGLIDQADPGCVNAEDPDEADPPVLPACGNGLDDDGDGAVDWPDDDDCASAGGAFEGRVCAGHEVVEVGVGVHQLGFELDSTEAGVTDGDCGGNGSEAVVLMRVDRPASLAARIVGPEAGVIASYLRTDCANPRTETLCDASRADRRLEIPRLEVGTYALFIDHDVGFAERIDRVAVDIVLEALPLRACENEIDDDGDGLIDAADPGCFGASDRDEVESAPAACADGLDNDGDGPIDFPDDRSCAAAGSAAEGLDCPGNGPFIPVGDAGGRFTVDARPFDPGQASARCGGDRGAEAIFVLDLTTPANVEVLAGTARVFLRSTCADAVSERVCDDDGHLALDALDSGRYFFFVEPGAQPADVEFRIDSLIRECNDRVDNDGDGLVDLGDPGCTGSLDRSELDPAEIPACFDEIDNDGDGATDWPADPQCRAAGDPEEDLVCDPALAVVELGPDGGVVELPAGGESVTLICGQPNRSAEVAIAVTVPERSRIRVLPEGRVSAAIGARTDCADAGSEFACNGQQGGTLTIEVEAGITWILAASAFGDTRVGVEVESLIRACNNGLDDDADGDIDAADPGCEQGFDDDEADPAVAPACADGLDNDGDGFIDWPDDPQCLAAGTADEAINCPPIDDVILVPPEGGIFDTNTRGRPNAFEAPCAGNARGGEQVLALVLDAPTRVVIETIQADYDTALFVRSSCLDDSEVIACDDDGGGQGNLSRIDRVFEVGIWYVFVDGFAENAGAAQVRVEFP